MKIDDCARKILVYIDQCQKDDKIPNERDLYEKYPDIDINRFKLTIIGLQTNDYISGVAVERNARQGDIVQFSHSTKLTLKGMQLLDEIGN